MEERCIENPFLGDISNSSPVTSERTLESLLTKQLHQIHSNVLIDLENDLRHNQPNINDDDTVYTGIAGLCFYYLNKYVKDNNDTQALQTCKEIYNQIITDTNTADNNKRKKKKKRITFLHGVNGLLTIGIILHSIDNNVNDFVNLLNQLQSQCTEIVDNLEDQYPFEILFGKCGYLQCLILIKRYCRTFLNGNVESKNLLDQSIELLIMDIVQNGRDYPYETESPLMYEWHESQYLGGIHGLSGILYMLMCAIESLDLDTAKRIPIDKDIQDSLDFLMGTMLPSGNFPSRPQNKNDRLVQFCHGAPGVIPTLVKAYSYFNKNPKYLDCAIKSSNAIWKHGLLVKGSGICHGISGNAYSFLLIYKESKDPIWLFKTLAFVKLLLTQSFFKLLNTPDNPYSLFEGVGGLAYLLNDLMNLYQSKDAYLPQIQFPSY
ncbi:hypothetical protein CYY_009197 [Polysphondylium violaceum]|uniref:Uncharacterized protein n=1 Tax=Polysphondylium violaceum TaxID=133409 RepID=A0A8J4PLZ7_9MYCE|nr:hypothetical protein CYY_009197 [Polysphondylium violaceum]